MNWRDCLVARDVLSGLGLATPRDVSLVVLDSNDDMAWVDPPPTRFHVGHEMVLRATLAWLGGKPHDQAQQTKSMLKGWMDGATLAAPFAAS